MIAQLNRRALQEYILTHATSQSAFARSASISGGYCTQLLTGKRNPSGIVRQKILAATGLPFNDLFEIVEDDEHAGGDHQ